MTLFTGLNKPGVAASANGGSQLTPPDSTGAVGPNNYVEMANSVIHVWDRNLNSVSSATLDNFLGAPGGQFCDVQIQWDPTASRWLFALLMCDTTASQQFFVVGWSRTTDPSQLHLNPGGWCAIGLTTTLSTGDSFLFDYPKLGHNRNFLIVGGNAYDVTVSSSNPPFLSALLAWVQLPANGDTSCPTSPFIGSSSFPLRNGDGSTLTFTPVPVNTDSNAADGYIVSAYDPAGNAGLPPAPQTKLAVWHVDSGGTLHQDADVPVNVYATPPPAVQSGTADVLDTLDARLTQAVGDPSTGIWTQHTVLNGGVSKVTWYELTRSGSSLTLTQQGDVAGAAGEYIFNAAISPTSGAHGAAIFYSRSSASLHPLIAARSRVDTTLAGTMDPEELVLATSPASDMDFSCVPSGGGPPCRWGDYSGASPDPAQSDAVWGTNMFITAGSSTPAWQNENFAVLIPPARVAVSQSGASVPPSRTAPNQAPPGTPGPR